MSRLADEAAIMRELGNIIINPPNFPRQVTGKSTVEATTATNKLARIFTSVSTIEVGNPLSARAAIDLRARVVDLPSDWTVALTPSSVTLDPGQQTTVTVTITPGAPVPQGTRARVSVEGYASGQLLGGVVEDVLVPNAVPFRMSIGGDANGDGAVTVADVFYTINNLFAGGPAPVVGDANGDGAVTVADVFYLINYLFAGGAPPA